jgi:hypothetical protein
MVCRYWCESLQEAKVVCAGCAVEASVWNVPSWLGSSMGYGAGAVRTYVALRMAESIGLDPSRPRTAYSVTAMSPSAIPRPGMSTCEY